MAAEVIYVHMQVIRIDISALLAHAHCTGAQQFAVLIYFLKATDSALDPDMPNCTIGYKNKNVSISPLTEELFLDNDILTVMHICQSEGIC